MPLFCALTLNIENNENDDNDADADAEYILADLFQKDKQRTHSRQNTSNMYLLTPIPSL